MAKTIVIKTLECPAHHAKIFWPSEVCMSTSDFSVAAHWTFMGDFYQARAAPPSARPRT